MLFKSSSDTNKILIIEYLNIVQLFSFDSV